MESEIPPADLENGRQAKAGKGFLSGGRELERRLKTTAPLNVEHGTKVGTKMSAHKPVNSKALSDQ